MSKFFKFFSDSGPTQKVKRKLPQNKKSKPLHELIKLNDKSTKTHLCHICGKVVPTAAKLKNHVMTTHKDLRVQCHICKKFVKEYCLKMHMKMHNNIKISKCTVCGEKFKHYFQKRKHEVEVHNISPTIYPCKLCGEKFFNTNRRSIHYRKIHLQLNKYVCQFCNQSFFTGGELKNHLAVHSNERNHKCELCGRLFKRKKTLADHVKVHFINKCEVCSKPFKDKKSLLAHVTTHQFY